MQQKPKKQPWLLGFVFIVTVALIVAVVVYLATKMLKSSVTTKKGSAVVPPLDSTETIAPVPTTDTHPLPTPSPTFFNWIYWLF